MGFKTFFMSIPLTLDFSTMHTLKTFNGPLSRTTRCAVTRKTFAHSVHSITQK